MRRLEYVRTPLIGYSLTLKQTYGSDSVYNTMFAPVSAAPNSSAAVAAAFTPQAPAYDPYGFEDDGFGSGALYPGEPMGLKNKRADTDREC